MGYFLGDFILPTVRNIVLWSYGMGCIVEFNDVRFDFAQNKLKQKTWIEALLRFTNLDINQLAGLLDTPTEMLIKVQRGDIYFSKKTAVELGKLFLLAFSD